MMEIVIKYVRKEEKKEKKEMREMREQGDKKEIFFCIICKCWRQSKDRSPTWVSYS